MKICITCNYPSLPRPLIEQLEILGTVTELKTNHGKFKGTELGTIIPDTEILICDNSSVSSLGAEALSELSKLKFICVYGSGTEWIDMSFCRKKNIVVSSTKGCNAQSTAEHIWGMILNLSKRISEFERVARNHGENNVNHFQGKEILGKCIGIIGLGNVGLKVAKMARAFDMDIIGFNKSGNKIKGIIQRDLNYLLRKSDIIVVCVPLSIDTKGLINSRNMKLLKPGAILINCAREKIVDKKSVLDALKKGRLFGYGVDLDIMEDISLSSEYYSYDNVIATPHNAWNTLESDRKSFERILFETKNFVRKYMEINNRKLPSSIL